MFERQRRIGSTASVGPRRHDLGGAGLPIVDEDVRAAEVGVVRVEICRVRDEGDEASICADGGMTAGAVGFRTRAADAHPLGYPCVAVVDKDVPAVVRVVADQVVGGRLEGHEAPIGADGGSEAAVVALLSDVPAGGGDAHQLGVAGPAVVDEDVPQGAVRVAPRDEVGRSRRERDGGTIGAEGVPQAIRVRLRQPRARHARQPLRGGLTVVDDDVRIGVVTDEATEEILGVRAEGDETPVGADGREAARSVGLDAPIGPSDGHPLDGIRFPVIDENVRFTVRVVRDEIVRARGKNHEAPVRADGDEAVGEATTVAFVARVVDAHALGDARLGEEAPGQTNGERYSQDLQAGSMAHGSSPFR